MASWSKLDGIEGREGVIVVAACNHPKMVDTAILRAGRLDRHVEISLRTSTPRSDLQNAPARQPDRWRSS
jgi:ATP-dependent 26S proteasome regulatory subunit